MVLGDSDHDHQVGNNCDFALCAQDCLRDDAAAPASHVAGAAAQLPLGPQGGHRHGMRRDGRRGKPKRMRMIIITIIINININIRMHRS
jgi:hypothetical protein